MIPIDLQIILQGLAVLGIAGLIAAIWKLNVTVEKVVVQLPFAFQQLEEHKKHLDKHDTEIIELRVDVGQFRSQGTSHPT